MSRNGRTHPLRCFFVDIANRVQYNIVYSYQHPAPSKVFYRPPIGIKLLPGMDAQPFKSIAKEEQKP